MAAQPPVAAPQQPSYTVPVQEPAPAAAPAPEAPLPAPAAAGQAAVLGITCGLVMHGGTGHAALVVEPTGPVGLPGNTSGTDEFLSLLQDAGFQPLTDVDVTPGQLSGWSVLMVMGQLHAILQPAAAGGSTGWWQAHQPLQVTDAWRVAAYKQAEVTMYAVPVSSVRSAASRARTCCGWRWSGPPPRARWWPPRSRSRAPERPRRVPGPSRPSPGGQAGT